MVASWVGQYSVSIVLVELEEGIKWTITIVYGPNNPQLVVYFWVSWIPRAMLPVGYFNVTRFPGERSVDGSISTEIRVSPIGLTPRVWLTWMSGARFTWSNHQSMAMISRMNFFCFHGAGLICIVVFSASPSYKPVLEHYLFPLDSRCEGMDPAPFRFELMLLEVELGRLSRVCYWLVERYYGWRLG